MLVGRKYRLAFTPEQAGLAETIGGICRSVWNTGLEYRRRGAWINYVEQAGQLADAKTEHDWLKQAPAHVLQQTLMDLDRTCRQHGTWKVRWRSARGWSPSFRFPDGKRISVERVGRRWGRAKLPKLGWVRFRWSRCLAGAVRSATVSWDGRHWFISFLVDDGVTTPEQHARTTVVGVDRGVTVAVACSDGWMRDREFRTPGEQRRYLALQKKLARQLRGSANREKTVSSMRRIKRRESDRRNDFVAWTASQLATRYSMVVIEKLNTKGMTRSARGTVELPGSRVSQKAGLNRAILDKGWHAFELALRNVARRTSCRVVTVPAPFTSQRCSECCVVDPESRESQAGFRCVACGHCENADVNAAKNVLADGLSVFACGDLGTTRSMKQEPGGIPRGSTTPIRNVSRLDSAASGRGRTSTINPVG
ncbi:RNA-guided endonuclease TnpB family protein [Kibdelosporangium aridum]|uniref:RNA-guided endonuclease InsQ/TnpB family protein n=1 Tax=Kibdelosporangium aridum TaxID=2030 RepID=UPI0007C4D533|nr:RNA-guided endonuclease TnpB family protein [Kibdelosporangium aridum]